MRLKHSGQRSSGFHQSHAVSLNPVAQSPKLDLGPAALFGQHAVAHVDGKPILSPMVSIPVRTKKTRTSF